jgi:hydrogenase maturation protease
VEHSRDGLALIEAWSGAERVILIDAVRTGAPAGTVSELDGGTATVAGQGQGTHAFGVAAAIRLARVLGRLPPVLRVYGIEAADFTPGRPPRPAVLEAVDEVVRRVILEVVTCTNPESSKT